MRKKWEITNDETRRRCIDELIARIQDIDEPESVGMIAVQDIVDIVLEHAGPGIYDAGLTDAKTLMQSKFTDTETELDLLRQSAVKYQ